MAGRLVLVVDPLLRVLPVRGHVALRRGQLELPIELLHERVGPADRGHEPDHVVRDEVRVDRRVRFDEPRARAALARRRERLEPRPVVVARPHPAHCGVEHVLPVLRPLQEALVVGLAAEALRELRQAPVLVGVLERLRGAGAVEPRRARARLDPAARDVLLHAAALGVGPELVAGAIANPARRTRSSARRRTPTRRRSRECPCCRPPRSAASPGRRS